MKSQSAISPRERLIGYVSKIRAGVIQSEESQEKEAKTLFASLKKKVDEQSKAIRALEVAAKDGEDRIAKLERRVNRLCQKD